MSNTKDSLQLIYNMIVGLNHPLAPKIFERAHGTLKDLGTLLINIQDFDEDKTRVFAEKLVGSLSTEDFERDGITPEFMVTLISMLRVAIEGYIANLPNVPLPPGEPPETTH